MSSTEQYSTEADAAKRRVKQYIEGLPDGIVMPRRGGGWIFTRPDYYDETFPCEGDYRCTEMVYPNDRGDDGRLVCYECLCSEAEWA